MSSFQFPSQPGRGGSPSQRIAGQGLPGLQNMRPAPDEARISLMRRMGEGFRKLGDEMVKGLGADPTEMTKAQSMIQQAQQAAQGFNPAAQGQQQPSGGPGSPRPADRGVDPISGAPIGTVPGGRNTTGV